MCELESGSFGGGGSTMFVWLWAVMSEPLVMAGGGMSAFAKQMHQGLIP